MRSPGHALPTASRTVCSTQLSAIGLRNCPSGSCGSPSAWPLMPTNRSTWSYRSEEHTSELQSQSNLVCRLLLEKKKNTNHHRSHPKTNTVRTVNHCHASTFSHLPERTNHFSCCLTS